MNTGKQNRADGAESVVADDHGLECWEVYTITKENKSRLIKRKSRVQSKVPKLGSQGADSIDPSIKVSSFGSLDSSSCLIQEKLSFSIEIDLSWGKSEKVSVCGWDDFI